MRAPVQARLLAVAILIVCAAQQNIAAGADAGSKDAAEKRFQFLFVPISEQAAGGAQRVRATAIVRGEREFKLILVSRDGSALVYLAQADPARCASHERIELAGGASGSSVLTVDGPLAVCRGVEASPTSPVTVRAGSKTFTVERSQWKAQGGAGIAEELGPAFAKIVTGPVTGLSQGNAFVRILCDQLAPLYGVACQGTTPTYTAMSLKVDCGFDALHGEPCTQVRSVIPKP